jgi:hypothetical protein
LKGDSGSLGLIAQGIIPEKPVQENHMQGPWMGCGATGDPIAGVRRVNCREENDQETEKMDL